jgi:hypothetical protein
MLARGWLTFPYASTRGAQAYAETLQEEIRVLLGQWHSIPAFLANIITDQWNAETSYTTFMGKWSIESYT